MIKLGKTWRWDMHPKSFVLVLLICKSEICFTHDAWHIDLRVMYNYRYARIPEWSWWCEVTRTLPPLTALLGASPSSCTLLIRAALGWDIMTYKGSSLELLWLHRRLRVNLNRVRLPIIMRLPRWAKCQWRTTMVWRSEGWLTTVSTEWTGNHLSPASSYPHSSSPGACYSSAHIQTNQDIKAYQYRYTDLPLLVTCRIDIWMPHFTIENHLWRLERVFLHISWVSRRWRETYFWENQASSQDRSFV